MSRSLAVAVAWLGCLVVIVAAYQSYPVPVRIGDVLVVHARFEEALAKSAR